MVLIRWYYQYWYCFIDKMHTWSEKMTLSSYSKQFAFIYNKKPLRQRLQYVPHHSFMWDKSMLMISSVSPTIFPTPANLLNVCATYQCLCQQIPFLLYLTFLLQLLHKQRSKVFGHPQRLNCHTNRSNTLCLITCNGMLRNTFLNSDIIRILREKVWHGSWVLRL